MSNARFNPFRFLTCFLLALVALALPSAGSAQGPCDYDGTGVLSDNCFILRAPRGLQNALGVAHGLVKVRDLAASDLDVILVYGPPSLLPETTLANLAGDPDVFSVEQVTLESLSYAASDSALDPSTLEGLGSLSATGTYSGAEAAYFAAPAWNGYLAQATVGQIQLDQVRAPAVAESFGTGVVAVIDTGVDPDHQLLQGALVSGYDFLLDTPGLASDWDALDPVTGAAIRTDLETSADQSYSTIVDGGAVVVDETPGGDIVVDQSYSTIVDAHDLPAAFGHGTMVSGLVRLVAPGAQIMPIRVFDGEGRASVADIVEAIYFAADNGADVINMSFSVGSHSEALARAIKYARRKGVVCVTSSGNAGSQELTYPAAYGEVIGVASIDSQDQPSSFSNWGNDTVFLSAPGEALITLFPGGLYAGAWGTSFSAALVSGSAALMHSILPSGVLKPVKPRKAEGALEESADVLDPTTTNWGAGRLDVEGSFNLERGLPDVD